MARKVQDIYSPAIYTKSVLTLNNNGLSFPIPRVCSVSPSFKDPDQWWLHHMEHGGLEWYNEGRPGESHTGFSELPPRMTPVPSSLISLVKANDMAPSDLQWPEKCIPPHAQKENVQTDVGDSHRQWKGQGQGASSYGGGGFPALSLRVSFSFPKF